jgi:hypothetical protein
VSAVDTLRILAAGKRPMTGLLHTARLEAFGVEIYGEEAIVEAFRRAPYDFSETATIIDVASHIAMFDGDMAIVADVAGDNIARIWRLGTGDPLVHEPSISVAFDPDLAQANGDVVTRGTDHPELAVEALESVRLAGQAIARAATDAYRTRASTIRAFGSVAEGAALFAVYRLTGDPARNSGFAMAAALWTSAGMEIVRDRVGEAAVSLRPWTPCVVEQL